MKIKGITIWEQYVEFSVLAIAAVVFVGFTAMQFIGDPNKVKKGMDEFSPEEVDDILMEESVRIAAGMDADAGSQINFPPFEPVLPEFTKALNSSIDPDNRLVRIGMFIPVDDAGEIGVMGKDFIDPQIAAPYNVAVKQSFDALQPFVLEDYEELTERFPEPPYDIAWVTVGAKFNVAEVLAQFQQEGPNGEQTFQERWYDSRIDILDITLEREEYLDGVWGNATILDPILGQVSFRKELVLDDFNVQDRDSILSELSDPELKEAVMRPNFLATVGEWLPPNVEEEQEEEEVARELTPEEEQILRLERILRKFQKEINNVIARLDEAGGEAYPQDDDDGPVGGGDVGPGGGGSGGGRVGSGGSVTNKMPLRIRLTARRDRLKKRIEETERRLVELGAMAEEDVEIEESPDEVIIWAHDMTIEAGRTYRYRLSVDVYNPLFAKKLHLPEAQHERAEQVTITSIASDWTIPLHADEWLNVFITQAHGPANQQNMMGGLGLGQARAEVFRFQFGRWWRETFQVEPGDRIGKARIQRTGKDGDEMFSVDFSTEWFLLDVIEDIEANRQARERGQATQALIHRIQDPGVMVLRNPVLELRDRLRRRLMEEVELAEIAGQVAGVSAN